jgi:hypothetical protein
MENSFRLKNAAPLNRIIRGQRFSDTLAKEEKKHKYIIVRPSEIQMYSIYSYEVYKTALTAKTRGRQTDGWQTDRLQTKRQTG